MVKFAVPLVSLLTVLPYALAQPKPQQCGGKGWTGPTVCPNAAWYECRINHYGQCGGQGWSGNIVCIPNTKCVFRNQFYSTCESLDFPERTPASD
ncbi:hypothetical protein BJ165DRAFT_1593536 [Panaeolus papilionaceus]|nr:hypothetical protein BJ165DRAFT_1593536 [Panaeolus papilionaceus]